MAVLPVNTIPVSYNRIGGLASASAKAHAGSREKFEADFKKELDSAQDKVDALYKKIEKQEQAENRTNNLSIKV